MSASEMFWEQFSVGQAWTHHRDEALAQDEIIAFAKQYDPLYMHTDPVQALSSPWAYIVQAACIPSHWLSECCVMRCFR